jgi:hypothetical protein
MGKHWLCASRLGQDIFGGAWCPKSQITTESTEWIEIDLHKVHVITGSATQGRFGNGQGAEYTESYLLEYWRPALSKWVRYRDVLGEEVIFITFITLPSRTCESASIFAPRRLSRPGRHYPLLLIALIDVFDTLSHPALYKHTNLTDK